jgi:Uncharacterised protein family (UPF0236)
MTDFGADLSFAKAVEKVGEHYGVEVNASAVRSVTEKHGLELEMGMEEEVRMPVQGVRELVAEMDGGFVPIVEVAEGEVDKRKTRSYKYQEARLCLAGQVGSVRRRYRATMGSVEDAGRHWKACVVEAGGGQNTELHCLGDGAPWIVRQAEKQFGEKAKFLVDFYHLSDYLGGASERIAGAEAKSWLSRAQMKMKKNEWPEVLAEIGKYVEGEEIADQEAPVRTCHRYIGNREEYLDYQGAIKKGLPIGSGEIESGHKSVVQSRLKITGAWWKVENAKKMLALRVTRANGDWHSYWQQQRQANA